MGKGSQTTTVKNEQSPQQKAIMQAELNHYMPGGKFTDKPTFTNQQITDAGQNRVAGFNQDQLDAFQKTRDTAFQFEGDLNDSEQMARDAAGPTGQKEALGSGWSTDANGNAVYRDFDPTNDVQSYMNPYTDDVINTSINDLKRANDIALQSNADAAVEAGAFGGSRHGVVDSLTNADYLRQVADTTSNLRYNGYNTAMTNALGQYNRGRDEGQEALTRNNQIDADNMKRLSDAADQIAKISQQRQDMTSKGIDALNNVGNIQQQHDQTVLDTGYDELMNQYLWPAQLGQMLSGFTPTASQTQTSNSGGSIWGSVGSAALGTGLQAALMAMSDERAKENIEEADPDDSLAEIRKLAKNGLYTYDYTDDAKAHGAPDGRRTGFMAQDLEDATGEEAPEVAGGYKGYDISEMVGRLTHAVAALDKKVSELVA